jgi:hypothetical protein
MIDWSKPIRLIGSDRPIRHVGPLQNAPFCHVVAVRDSNGSEHSEEVTEDGRFYTFFGVCIENIAETVKVEVRLHVFRDRLGSMYYSLSPVAEIFSASVCKNLAGETSDFPVEHIGNIDIKQTLEVRS